MQYRILLTGLVLSVALGGWWPGRAPGADRPNVVVFLVDDMGWQDTSVPFHTARTPWNDRYRTPNMERLAAEGMKFTQAYACPVCTPTRVSLITGLNAARHRATNWTLRKDTATDVRHAVVAPPAWNVNGLSPDPATPRAVCAPTLPQLLREAGYRTIHVGKAHFGALDTPGAEPRNLGFDVNIAGHAAGGPGSYLGTQNFSAAWRKGERVWDVPGLEAYHGQDIFLTEALTREANRQIDRAVADRQPFFLYLAHYAVHVPYAPDTRFYQKYRDAGLDDIEAQYAALVEGMDKSLGDVLDNLHRHQLDGQTIVLFLSDNGGLSAHGRGGTPHTHNAPLSSGKGSGREGGIRVPLLVKWPGVVQPGSVCRDPVIVEDLLPTILAMTGAEKRVAQPPKVDGRSFVPQLRGQSAAGEERTLLWHYPHIWGPTGPGLGPFSAIRRGDWKLIYYHADGRLELFNLADDLSEQHNLAAEQPGRLCAMAAEMTRRLKAVEAQMPTLKQNGQPVAWPDAVAAAASATAATADFYVAPQGNDAWSGHLSAPNAARDDGPFATLRRAKQAVRKAKAGAPHRPQPWTVMLRGGTYRLAATEVFTPDDSGTVSLPVIYQAYPGETPILSGGQAIGPWRQVQPGRWEVHLDEVAAGRWWFSQLYVNDQRRDRPVLPKQGYYFIGGELLPQPGPPSDRFVFRSGEIRGDWHDLGRVEVDTFHLWTMARSPIRAVDAQQPICTLSGVQHNREQAPLSPNTWYRLENVREALAEPGQWYLDRMSGVLTYLSLPGEDPNRAVVIAPRLPRIVTLEGDPAGGRFVEHLVFRGLTLAHTAWNVPEQGYRHFQAEAELDGAITAVGARHCALEDCVVRHTGSYGVDFGAGCRDCRLVGCELVDLGAGGVKIGPFRFNAEPDPKRLAAECLVRDNLIAHGGRVHPAGVGVLVGHAWDNTIEHNHVFDFYYSGMSIGWRWTPGPSPAHHNTIADNHIHDIGQGVLSDMAGIYTLGESPGSVLRGNHIHDVSRARYGGWGIYFDASSGHITAENNLVYRTEDAGLHQNYGADNTVRNNIFACGRNGQIRFSDPRQSGPLLLERNLFYFRAGPLFEIDRLDDEFHFAGNLYWSSDEGEKLLFPGHQTLAQWRQREPAAVVADPQFAAPDEGDFRLQPESPARRVGFVPFDAGTAGRLTRSDRTAALPPVPRAFAPAPPDPLKQPVEAIVEDFESLAVGQLMPGFTSDVQAGESVAVSDDAAERGRRSLKFQGGPPHATRPWTPHIFRRLDWDRGRVRNSFDLRLEPGAEMRWEWRDWPTFATAYTTGPQLSVLADGTLRAGNRTLGKLPHLAWVHVEIDCALGPDSPGKYRVTVTRPAADPLVYADLPCQAGFKDLRWVGFSSSRRQPAAYWIDNFRLERAK